jgi:hypothetical protein
LEADIDALVRLYALRDLECLFCLADVDAHRLLAVDMLASIDRCGEMLDMEERRCRDLDHIDILRCRQFFEGVGAAKEQLAVDRCAGQAAIHFVEVGLACRQLIREDIGQSDDLPRCVLRKRGCDRRPAVAAS